VLVVKQLTHRLDRLLAVLLGRGVGVDLDSREVVDVIDRSDLVTDILSEDIGEVRRGVGRYQ